MSSSVSRKHCLSAHGISDHLILEKVNQTHD